MIASPCINVCQVDAQSGLCTGCFRTIDEITVWSQIDDRRRANILAAVAQRRLRQAPMDGALHGDGVRHG
jgi:uncharacterized protein